MKFRITTQHADYEKLFGGPSVIVERTDEGLRVIGADRAELIGEAVDVCMDHDIVEQLSAMYGGAEVEILVAPEMGYRVRRFSEMDPLVGGFISREAAQGWVDEGVENGANREDFVIEPAIIG